MAMQTEFSLPKKRDEITERTLLAGIGYEREVRFDEVMEVSPWIKEGYNFLEIGKNPLMPSETDRTTYACAMYICKKI